MLSLRRLGLAVLVAVLTASAVSAKGAIGIKNGKIAVTSPDGLSDATYALKEPTPLPAPITLTEAATFKLTFTVVNTASGESIFPQQAHLLFEDPKGDDVTLPVAIKANGRASFTINTAKPPTALLSTHGSFSLTLLLSTLDTASTTPLLYPLGELTLPSSILRPVARKRHDLPPRQGEPAFQAEREVFHTFREDEKSVGVVKSAVGTGLVLAPWAVLALLYAKISPSVDRKAPPASSYAFLGCLAALEGLIFTYWIGLKLYEFLPIFLPLSLVSAYTGKVALGSLRERRLKAGGAP